jgi:hypothetical protein
MTGREGQIFVVEKKTITGWMLYTWHDTRRLARATMKDHRFFQPGGVFRVCKWVRAK